MAKEGEEHDGVAAPTLDPATAPTLDAALASTLAAPEAPLESRTSLTGEVSHADDARYDIGAELGRGGIGRVVLAHDKRLGRDVALKELLSTGAAGSTVAPLARFLREARVTARLEHPGIVPVHELGRRADGSLFYTMKRVRGRSLAQIVRAARTPAERLTTLSAFRHVCDAVAYAHSRGVVHRDLKPDNVMIGAFGETVVLDWGIAKVSGAPDVEGDARPIDVSGDAAKTAEGSAMGTPSYMAPEQARGAHGEVDARSDVWGLGAILFEILTGSPPFTGTNVMEVLAKVLSEPAPRVADREPNAPPELAAIADRALQRDPAGRYRSAAELSTDVAAYLDGRAVGAYGYSSLELLRRFVRRNRAATIASVLVLVATAGAAIYSYARYRGELAARQEADRRRVEADDARAALGREVDETSRALAAALVARSESALREHDPLVAQVFATAALESSRPALDNVPLNQGTLVRARSAYLAARETSRWEVERIDDLGAVRPDYLPSLAVSLDGALVVYADDARLHVARAGSEPAVVEGSFRVAGLLADGSAFVDAGSEPGVRGLDGALRFPLPFAPGAPRAVAVTSEVIVLGGAHGELAWIDTTDAAILEQRSLAAPITALAGDATSTVVAALVGDRTHVVVAHRGGETVTHALPWPGSRLVVAPSGRWVAVGGLGNEVLVVRLPSGELVSHPIAEVGSDAVGLAPIDDDTMFVGTHEGIPAHQDVLTMRVSDGTRTLVTPLPMRRTERLELAQRGDTLVGLLAAPETGGGAVLVRWRYVDGARIERDVGAPVYSLGEHAGAVYVATPRVVLTWPSVDALAADPGTPLLEPDGGIVEARAVEDMVVARTRDGVVHVRDSDGATRGFRDPRPPEGLLGMAGMGGGRLAVGSAGGDIEIWNARTGVRESTLEGVHEGPVLDVAVSHDGTHLASSGADRRVCVTTLATGRLEGCVSGYERLAGGLAFSPDDSQLASSDGLGWVRILDTATRDTRLRFRAHGEWVNRVTWSADGALLLTVADDGTGLFQASDGAPLRILDTGVTSGGAFFHDDAVACVPHGRSVECFGVDAARSEIDPHTARATAEAATGRRLDGFELVPR